MKYPVKHYLTCALIICLSACTATTGKNTTEIDMARFMADVRQLASDEFGGRAPSLPGEALTVDYLVDGFRAAGLVGGNGGSFVQEVPLAAITATEVAPMMISGQHGALMLESGSDAVVWTKRVTGRVAVMDSQLVFVGYGIVATSQRWLLMLA